MSDNPAQGTEGQDTASPVPADEPPPRTDPAPPAPGTGAATGAASTSPATGIGSAGSGFVAPQSDQAASDPALGPDLEPAFAASGSGQGSPPAREYRITELARAAGIPVRTLRYYQERKLLPPPRREGRIGLYSEDHLARLRMIASLLERGHTLEGIRELLSAWEQGRDIEAVLGVEKAVTTPWSTETPVTMSADELAGLFPEEISQDLVERAVALGHITIDGDRVTHWSRRQLEATLALVRAGVPLREVLSASERLQRNMDDLAALFVRLITRHVVERRAGRDLGGLTDTLAELRPGAQIAVEAAFARAMDRAVRAEIDRVLARLASGTSASADEQERGQEQEQERDHDRA